MAGAFEREAGRHSRHDVERFDRAKAGESLSDLGDPCEQGGRTARRLDPFRQIAIAILLLGISLASAGRCRGRRKGGETALNGPWPLG